MKLITTDNWQCVAASFAMVMDTTVEDLIERTGHDGKALILDDTPPPEGWRSWHPEEFVDLLLESGYAATMVSLQPAMIHGRKLINHAAFLGQDRFFKTLLYGSGVIFGQIGEKGRGHAVAWNRDELRIYDPAGRVYAWEEAGEFLPRQFYLIQKVDHEKGQGLQHDTGV